MTEALRPALRLQIPLPPSANSIWRAVAGRVILSADYRRWKATAARSIRAQLPPNWQPLAGPVRLIALVVVPSLASDVGNRLKALEDACTEAGVWLDDRQVGAIQAHKCFPADAEGAAGYVVLTVSPLVHSDMQARLDAAKARAARKTAPRRAASNADESAQASNSKPRTRQPRASEGYGANVTPNVRRGE